MSTYRCARELDGHCLQKGDYVVFSNVGEFTVAHNTKGWFLLGAMYIANNAVFKYLYGFEKSAYEVIKNLGDYPTVEGGVFPFLTTVGALTEVVGKLFLEVERKRFREFDFNRYIPKGNVAALSRENVFDLCKNQVEQGNVFDVRVFESNRYTGRSSGGIAWARSKEGELYWRTVLSPSLYTAPSIASDISLEETAARPSDLKKMTWSSSSLATLSAKRTQKPKLRTL